jgi:hypothetical protein
MHRHEMRILTDYIKKPQHKGNSPEAPEPPRPIYLNDHHRKTNTAVSVNASEYKKKLEQIGKLSLDLDVCRKEFEWRQGQYTTFAAFFDEVGADVLDIT